MGDMTGGRNIAEYDWCDVVYRDCTNSCETDAGCDCIYPEIHAPHPDVVREFDDWDGDPVEGTSACGEGVRLLVPGLFSRMGAMRCDRCCDLWDLPYGKGSPKNDDACRELLGMPPSWPYCVRCGIPH